jgi:hypothetical protein
MAMYGAMSAVGIIGGVLPGGLPDCDVGLEISFFYQRSFVLVLIAILVVIAVNTKDTQQRVSTTNK